MQITKCTPSKSHLSFGELFNLSVTIKMGTGETLPSTGAGSFIQFDGACNNQYWFFNDQPISETLLGIYKGSESMGWLENIGIGSGASKTITLSGVHFDGDSFQSRIQNLPDNGAARAYPYAFMLRGLRGSDYATYSAALDSVGVILLSRLDPVINDITVDDAHPLDPLSHFGAFVQGRSLPRIAADVTLDPLDPTLTAVHSLTLTQGGATVYSASNPTGIFEPGALAVAGAVDWSYTVTDSAGNSASDSGSFTVVPYAAPTISTLRAERYKVVLDDVGDPSYPAADDGELVRFTISADVASVAALNAWDMSIKYGRSDGTGGTTIATPLSGTDGAPETIRKIDDRTLVTAAIPASADYDFEVTLSDFFGPVKLVVSVYKAGGYFSVEKFGTGSGMRTTGTPESPCSDFAWPIKAWDDVIDRDGNKIVAPVGYSTEEMDTGMKWIDGKPIYRKVVITPTSSTQGAAVVVSLGEAAIGHVVNIYGGYVNPNGHFIPVPYTHATVGYTIRVVVQNVANNPDVQLTPGGSTNLGSPIYMIVEYTLPD